MADQAKDKYQSGPNERQIKGKEIRNLMPRSSHGDWALAPNRLDPISMLQAQDSGRLQHLLPVKYGRIVASPFSFLRGSAVVMASDMAATPSTGLYVVLCGDAHTGDAAAIGAYLGSGEVFDKAIGKFALAYGARRRAITRPWRMPWNRVGLLPSMVS